MNSNDALTSRQKEIAIWFKERAPAFEEPYVVAVNLLQLSKCTASCRLVCHIARDIYRYLPESLGIPASQRLGDMLSAPCKELADVWPENFTRTNPQSDPTDATYAVGDRAIDAVGAIVKCVNSVRSQETVGQRVAKALIGTSERSNADPLEPWIMSAFDKEYEYFVKRAHMNSGAPTDDLHDRFRNFEEAFHAIVGSYFSGKDDIDAILRDANAGSD